jgi:preprotein translocase subunit SecD
MQLLKITAVCSMAMALGAGCSVFQSLGQPKIDTTVRIYEEANSGLPAENMQTAIIPSAGLRLPINSFPTLTEKDVASAELYNTAGGKAIFLRFDPHGEIALDEMTTRTRGRYVVVMINNHPVSAWLVDQRIMNGQFLIEGQFTDEEAQKIVDDLNKLAKLNSQ